jgi:hypothetical protein
MRKLPAIDLLILMGWSSLFVGATQKVIWMTTSYRPTVLSFTPLDFLSVAGICLVLAMLLGAVGWVRLRESRAIPLARPIRTRVDPTEGQAARPKRAAFERPVPARD